MMYIVFCSFLFVMSTHRMYCIALSKELKHEILKPLKMMAIFVPTLATLSPYIVTAYALSYPIKSETLNILSISAQWLGLASTAILFAFYAYEAYRAYTDVVHRRHVYYTAAAVASVLLGLLFIHSLAYVSTGNTAVLATAALGDGVSNEVKCQQPALIVHYSKGGETAWRCPTGIMLMSSSSHPFVPWPDYQDGKSAALTTVMDVLTGTTVSLVKEKS